MNWFGMGNVLRSIWEVLTAQRSFGSGAAQERNELLTQLVQEREQYRVLMTNHLAHLDTNLTQQTTTLMKISDVQDAQLKTLDSMCAQIRETNDKNREAFISMDKTLEVIKDRTGRSRK